MSERAHCNRCGKGVSSPVPSGTVVRAWVECPECVEKDTSGFKWDDVDVLRTQANIYDEASPHIGSHYEEAFRDLADRIAALLPPRTTE